MHVSHACFLWLARFLHVTKMLGLETNDLERLVDIAACTWCMKHSQYTENLEKAVCFCLISKMRVLVSCKYVSYQDFRFYAVWMGKLEFLSLIDCAYFSLNNTYLLHYRWIKPQNVLKSSLILLLFSLLVSLPTYECNISNIIEKV